MSFSRDVKEELSKINNLANKQEVKYEFLGYLMSNNIIENSKMIKYSTENDYNIDRFAKIIRNIGIEEFDIQVNGQVFFIQIKKKHLEEIKDLENVFGEKSKTNNTSRTNNTNSTNNINSTIIFNSELDNDLFKSFMRGLFMGSGSINNPENKYHLECGVRDKEILQQIIDIMKDNSIFVKQMENIFYIKDGEEISKFLAFIGASKSVLKFEEIRVKRHMNNKVNRIVNCQSANLNKVLNASIKEVEAIRKLKQNGEFKKIDDGLKEIAEIRLEFPDMPLSELGSKLSVPLGKSGVNYRLKKIIKIANGEI